MREGWIRARTVLTDALRFFGRHCLVVAAFGVLASAQRFLSVSGVGWAGGLAGEVFTAAVRLAFLAWLVSRLFRGRRFVSTTGPVATTVVASVALLLVVSLVFKLVPDAVVDALPAETSDTAQAWILAVKNVTIIPFTMLWMTMLVRDLATERTPVPQAAPEPSRA